MKEKLRTWRNWKSLNCTAQSPESPHANRNKLAADFRRNQSDSKRRLLIIFNEQRAPKSGNECSSFRAVHRLQSQWQLKYFAMATSFSVHRPLRTSKSFIKFSLQISDVNPMKAIDSVLLELKTQSAGPFNELSDDTSVISRSANEPFNE